jgi:N-acetylmuramoyl-L-alanine amidase
LAWPKGTNPPGEVTEVRFWAVGEVTRVAIQVSAEFKYKSDHLHDPERLFFDIQGARPSMVRKGTHTIPLGDGKISKSGWRRRSPASHRVVLDLESDLEFTASQLSNPERLMVELRSQGQDRDPRPRLV